MRRIVVDARAFSDAMAKVSRVLKKSPLPILGEICVSVRDGICTLTATDLETWITARLPVQGDDLTFVFNRTKDVMKALAHMDGELVMELTERAENSKEPQKLRLYCAQRLAEYEVSSIKDYPEMVMVEADKVFRANAEHLLESIERVRYKAFHAGMECPTCHRPVTEQSLSEVQAALKKVISDLYAAGTEQRGQLTELQEMDKKAADTFEQFKADDLAKWQTEAAELEQACTDLSGSASKEVERLRMEIQTLSAELDYGNLTQPEYDRLAECRKELQQCEAKLAALEEMVAADRPNFDKEIQQARDTIGEIKRSMTDVVSYICKRAELTFSQLKMNKVEISLYDVVKSTGEAKDTFKFTYGGRRYDRLSLSEKIRAGMEVSELMKRLTGRNYPVFVDNMESVDDLANVRPTGQIIMAKCIANTALQVRPVNPIIHMEQKAA